MAWLLVLSPPFGLSLSKARLSCGDEGEREGFDKLSPNGGRDSDW